MRVRVRCSDFLLTIRDVSFMMKISGTPHVSAPFLIWERQIKVLCRSYLMGLAPQCVFFFWPAPCICFYELPFLLFSPPLCFFSSSSSSSLVSLCLCDMENVVRRNHENKKMCVDPPAPPVRLMVLFVVPQESELSPPIILFFAPPSSAGAQNGLAFPGASGHKRRPRLLQSYQGTNGWVRICRHKTH